MTRLLKSFFSLPVVGQIPMLNVPSQLQSNGATPDVSSLISTLNSVNLFNTQDASLPFVTVSGASATADPIPGQVTKFTNAGAITVTLDYAYNIVNGLLYPFLGQAFWFQWVTTGAGGSIATPTLSDTAVTLAGTTSLAATSVRWFQAQITQLATVVGAALTAGTTFTSLTQVGSTNAFTVALGTNAISPTVGQAILINTTAGTLPPGWYPIVKVTSATSFVIATPPGTVWTATAASLPGTTTVPVAAYNQPFFTGSAAGSYGIFSPLITITGLFGFTGAVA